MYRTFVFLALFVVHSASIAPVAQGADVTPVPVVTEPDADGGAQDREGTRRALLVGIEDYPRTSGWPVLQGPRADVALFRRALIERAGFEARHVRTLFDAQATKENILGSLRALAASAEPGDLLLFYFAGHGSQVPDQRASPDAFGGGQEESDGLDETLVPYDPFAADGSPNDLRDDELSAWIRFANGYTQNVVLIFDCCSSGTNVRGGESTVRFVAPEVRFAAPEVRFTAPEVRGLGGKRKSTGRVEGSGYLRPADDLSYVSLAACRASESAFEVRIPGGQANPSMGAGEVPDAEEATETVHGLFTHTLVREMYRNAGRTSYASLLDRVRHQVRRLQPQTPVVEGRLDRGVAFAGGLAVRPHSFGLRKWSGELAGAATEDRFSILAGGAVDGLVAGAVLRVFADAEAIEAGTVLGRVRLVDVQATSARAVWLGELPEGSADGPWRAVLEMPSPARSRLVVGLSEALDEALREELVLALAAHSWIDLVTSRSAPRALTIGRGEGEEWRVSDAAGTVLPLASFVAEGAPAELAAWMATLARARSVQRDLVRETVPSLPLDATLEQLDERGTALGTPARDASGRWRMQAGDVLRSTLANLGPAPVYASLLVVAPDGEVALVQRPFSEDESLAPGGVLTSPALRLTLPEGNEAFYRDEAQTFRWIVSTGYHDLRHLEQAACNDVRLRGTTPPAEVPMAEDDWRTASFAVLVEPGP